MSEDKDIYNPYELPESTSSSSSGSDNEPHRGDGRPGTSLDGNQDFSGETVDVVVVGTGASGGMAINKLARGGFKVVALEKGPFVPFNDPRFLHDELQKRKFNPLVPNRTDYPETWRPDTSTPTITTRVVTCNETVGGGVNHYATHCYRWKPVDFAMRSTYGKIPGADMEDWPFTYDDLEPFYTEAEYIIGQSGDANYSNPFEGPHSRDFPNPPLPRKYSDVLLMEAGNRIGRNVFPMPSAANSRGYGGKDKCHLCSTCSGYICDVGAKGNSLTAALPQALSTGNLEIRTHCYVTRVLINASGRCTGVEYIDARSDPSNPTYHVQECDIVVLAATAPQTTQILLWSANQHGLFENGLGNSSGRLGKDYVAHHFSGSGAYIDRNLDNWTGISSNSNIHDWYEHYHEDDPDRNYVATHGCMLGGGSNQPIGSRSRDFAGTDAPSRKWGLERKQYFRSFYGNDISSANITSGLSRLENQIDLDPVVVNKWGLPVPRYTTSSCQNDRLGTRYIAERLKELFSEMEGVVSVWGGGLADGAHVKGNIHQVGTARMGNNPRKSVTNRYCQFHDVPNLFVADPSAMTTQGGGDTTLTTTALGLWVGHHIVERKGDIPLP